MEKPKKRKPCNHSSCDLGLSHNADPEVNPGWCAPGKFLFGVKCAICGSPYRRLLVSNSASPTSTSAGHRFTFRPRHSPRTRSQSNPLPAAPSNESIDPAPPPCSHLSRLPPSPPSPNILLPCLLGNETFSTASSQLTRRPVSANISYREPIPFCAPTAEQRNILDHSAG